MQRSVMLTAPDKEEEGEKWREDDGEGGACEPPDEHVDLLRDGVGSNMRIARSAMGRLTNFRFRRCASTSTVSSMLSPGLIFSALYTRDLPTHGFGIYIYIWSEIN